MSFCLTSQFFHRQARLVRLIAEDILVTLMSYSTLFWSGIIQIRFGTIVSNRTPPVTVKLLSTDS
ncbi:MAG: hypothetical protein SXA11_20430 [Cyanobacteriota bacterium]|nr:hypothetical protein [Cyanobacteriota bacterium]